MWQLKLSGLHDDITGKDKVIILITQATVKIIIIKMILWVIMSETLHKNNIKLLLCIATILKLKEIKGSTKLKLQNLFTDRSLCQVMCTSSIAL